MVEYKFNGEGYIRVEDLKDFLDMLGKCDDI